MITIFLGQRKPDLDPLKEIEARGRLLSPSINRSKLGHVSYDLLIPPEVEDAREYFCAFRNQFTSWVEADSMTVFVASANPHDLQPLENLGYEGLIAMLILAFPEVNWIFGSIRGYQNATENSQSDENEKARAAEHNRRLDRFRSMNGLQRVFANEVSGLFDGNGLRDWVRENVQGIEKKKDEMAYVPRRRHYAFAVDEERPYAYLHTYTAYRFGYRAVPITTAGVANELLCLKHISHAHPHLVMEDVYLNFADGAHGMSELSARGEAWKRLEEAEHRIFVTSGRHDDAAKWNRNREYIAEQKISHQLDILYKPYAGIFRLWDESSLRTKLRWTDHETQRVYRGVAYGFIWPPSEECASSPQTGHSSPGILLVIAETLIARAEKLLQNVYSVEEAVRGAVLTNDALELLGCRTPTVAVQALRLKHHFEVLAECQFAGVEHHIQLDARLDEIKRDVLAISQWFGPHQRETAALNAEMQILIALVQVFRDFGQFDEENICMRQVRRLNSKLWFRTHGVWVAPVYCFRLYVEYLLASLPRFFTAITVWILVLMILFTLSGASFPGPALLAAVTSFVGIQPPEGNLNTALTVVAMLSGATHLGIFISHLYTLVSRK